MPVAHGHLHVDFGVLGIPVCLGPLPGRMTVSLRGLGRVAPRESVEGEEGRMPSDDSDCRQVSGRESVGDDPGLPTCRRILLTPVTLVADAATAVIVAPIVVVGASVKLVGVVVVEPLGCAASEFSGDLGGSPTFFEREPESTSG
ncbi:MAG: hypothetical protein NXI31_22090 [bacterium]|nr:hypothetical protein [bacterium]